MELPITETLWEILKRASMGRLRLNLWLLYALCTCVAATQQPAGPFIKRGPQQPSGYVGQEACAPCHSHIYKTFQEVGMARSLYQAGPNEVIGDYIKNNTFYHKKSGFYYSMLERNGKFFQRRYLLDRAGKPIRVHEEEVTYVVGSGNHARSYLHHHPNGVITQLPITWYAREKRWGMSPGYDSENHPDFTRAIPQACVFCHTAYPRLDANRSDDAEYFPFPLPAGIGCERCHGPGERHVQLADNGEPPERLKKAIYNPVLDSKEAQRQVCYQCHMETSINSAGTRVVKLERGLFSYKPGEPFAGYAVQLSLQGSESRGFQLVQHAELMEQSRCFKASGGQMTCTTCHNPHEKVPLQQSADYYRQRCLGCHETRKLSRHGPSRLMRDCTECHMPRGTPTNAGHTVFTNHKIGIYSVPRAKPNSQTGALGQLVIGEKNNGLSEAEQLFYVGAGYLDAPLAELAERPDLAREGMNRIQAFIEASHNDQTLTAFLPRAHSLLGKAYQALNLSDKAIEAYEKSLKLEEGLLHPLYNLALLRAHRGALAQSEDLFSKLLRRFPDYVPAIHGLGALAEASGRTEMATQYFERAITLFPGAVSSHYRLAQIYLQRQQWSKATEELQTTLSLSPRFFPALMDLGQIFASQNNLSESRQMFEEALKVNSSSEDAYNAVSLVAQRQGDLLRSQKVLEKALQEGVAGEATYLNLGTLYAGKGDFDQAIHFLELARDRNPQNPRTLMNLGAAYIRVGNATKGKQLLGQVLKLDPQNREARQLLQSIPGP